MGYEKFMDGFISIYLGQVKKTNFSRSDFCKKERAGAFFVFFFFYFRLFLLFPVNCFLYTLLPSPRDKLEFLDQIIIKWNVRYWLNTILFYFDTCFKQQRDASYDISQ